MIQDYEMNPSKECNITRIRGNNDRDNVDMASPKINISTNNNNNTNINQMNTSNILLLNNNNTNKNINPFSHTNTINTETTNNTNIIITNNNYTSNKFNKFNPSNYYTTNTNSIRPNTPNFTNLLNNNPLLLLNNTKNSILTNTTNNPNYKESSTLKPKVLKEPEIEEIKCKICLEDKEEENSSNSSFNKDNPFIFPCKCKGSMKYIHKKCLTNWIIEKFSNDPEGSYCEACLFPYRIILMTRKKPLTLIDFVQVYLKILFLFYILVNINFMLYFLVFFIRKNPNKHIDVYNSNNRSSNSGDNNNNSSSGLPDININNILFNLVLVLFSLLVFIVVTYDHYKYLDSKRIYRDYEDYYIENYIDK